MMKNLLTLIAAGALFLSSQSYAENQDTLRYDFKAVSRIPILNLFNLLTGEIKYYKNYNEIYGEIIPTGGIIKIFNKKIRHRIYQTTFYPDSIIYTQDGDSLSDSLSFRKKLDRNSPYFDALTSIATFLEHIERDSLEYHQLIRDGFIDIFVDNKIVSAKLSSLSEKKIRYKGKEIIAKKISIENLPDEKTFFDIYVFDKKVIKINCSILGGSRINLNAEISEKDNK